MTLFAKRHRAGANERIFVQVAAYRDPELVPTLRDCLAQADHPALLTFGICWQHAEGDSLEEFANHPNLRLRQVPYRESRGACWARSETQALYGGETYTLQIDSHHRFSRSWDSSVKALFREAVQRGSRKPLITSYAPAYDPAGDERSRGTQPLRLVFHEFSEQGPVQVMPEAMPGTLGSSRLEPARFLSAHFLFTLGSFCTQVPYDPKLYFFGEEPGMAIRAFTHGYDLFHPKEPLLWHYYGRDTERRHWGDNTQWWLRHQRSLLRYQRLIAAGGESQTLEDYGLGTQRTLRQYERYAGLSLAARKVSAHTLKGLPPPQPWLDRWSARPLLPERVIDVPLRDLPPGFGELASDRLAISALNRRGREVAQRQLTGDAMRDAVGKGCYRLRLYSADPPSAWRVVPWREAKGWCHATTG
ncbi:MAG: hypothetical protein KDI09_06285 [Halioglobus sp.]|nr:hypothetical protein [Halioglobus sp.]